VDLAARALAGLVERAGIDPALVEDVIMGCVSQVGEQSINVARNAALAAGFPRASAARASTASAARASRRCTSPRRRHRRRVRRRHRAGVESMSRVPMGTSAGIGGTPFGPTMLERYRKANLYGKGGLVQQGISAEIIAEKWSLSREACDTFSAWLAAASGGRGSERVVREGDRARSTCAGRIGSRDLITSDEGVRPDTTPEKLAALKPAFKPDGVITAGNSSQITGRCRGRAGHGEAEGDRARPPPARPLPRLRARRRRSRHHADGADPGDAERPRARGMKLGDIDAIEINEAFARSSSRGRRNFIPT
jgi:acetyl-CoA acetyltransferase